MKNFTKSILLLSLIILFVTSCKDNILEDLDAQIGKRCLESSYEKYENGKLLYKTISEYNSFNKLSKKTSISSNETSITLYEYDINNNLVRLIDIKGNIKYMYLYDSNNKLIKEGVEYNNVNFPDYTINYEYYPSGNLRKQTILLANLIEYLKELDEKGNLIKKYNADIDGNPLEAIPLKVVKETEIFCTYNSQSYILSQYVTVNKKFLSGYDYEYDTDNKITKHIVRDLNGTTIKNYYYLYDNKKRFISIKTDDGLEEKREYNNDDLAIKISYFKNNLLQSIQVREYNSSKKIMKDTFINPEGNIISKAENTYYSDNSFKTVKYYSLKNGTGTEIYKTSEMEYTPCGNIIKKISFNVDGSEKEKIIATYLYR